MPLSKDDILKVEDMKRELVSVPEWGGDVLVRTMTGCERDQFERELFPDGVNAPQDLSNFRARLASYCLCDEDGQRLFTNTKDVAALSKKGYAALDRILVAAKRLNGIGEEEVEALAGNSGSGHSDASASS